MQHREKICKTIYVLLLSFTYVFSNILVFGKLVEESERKT